MQGPAAPNRVPRGTDEPFDWPRAPATQPVAGNGCTGPPYPAGSGIHVLPISSFDSLAIFFCAFVSPMKIPPSLCGIRVIRGKKNSHELHELHEKTMTKAIFIRSGEPQDHGNFVVDAVNPSSPPRHKDTKVTRWKILTPSTLTWT